jgi:hypothetical protein
MLLKSSDFITHDVTSKSVFSGCIDEDNEDDVEYKLELVLRKWYAIERSRELRCFVRDDMLLGPYFFRSLVWHASECAVLRDDAAR